MKVKFPAGPLWGLKVRHQARTSHLGVGTVINDGKILLGYASLIPRITTRWCYSPTQSRWPSSARTEQQPQPQSGSRVCQREVVATGFQGQLECDSGMQGHCPLPPIRQVPLTLPVHAVGDI
jgi:hypothetical protein